MSFTRAGRRRGVVGWDNSGRREMARRVNEYTAGLVAKRPDRFGHFATLPLPDVDGALQELEHALNRQRIANVRKQSIQTNEYQSVDSAKGEFLWSSPPQNVYLLPQCPNLCLERCPRPK
jgi:predicted TIM-barrel fold metal-dependent hydrolase